MAIKNQHLFKILSPESAYLLGYILTDGTLTYNDITKRFFVQIYSSDYSHLAKIKTLLGTDNKIQERKETHYGGTKQGKIHWIYIGDQTVVNDLITCGMVHGKERAVRFPYMEPDFVPHFIRGCWAGSGSVHLIKRTLISSFRSTSYRFIQTMLDELYKVGLKERTIYEDKVAKLPTFHFKYATKDSAILVEYLYNGVGGNSLLWRDNQLKTYMDYYRTHHKYPETSLFLESVR